MMNKTLLKSALLLGFVWMNVSCSNDNAPVSEEAKTEQVSKNLDYTSANAASWGNYMRVVAQLLANDATTLYDDWTSVYNNGQSYAAFFKSQDALLSVQQLIDGCADIANEVGTAKIGDPYSLYVSGDTEKALYAVESWYSWHSREDYRNNIYSIRNAYYGSRNGEVSARSMAEAVKAGRPEVDTKMRAAIDDAAAAIWAIPSPFRNHINSAESKTAMEACGVLNTVLDIDLKAAVEAVSKSVLADIVANYVDVVVVPTYADLKAGNQALLAAVEAFRQSPGDSGFKACATAWLAAREPWETSEAFLFGPVADKGLDPNMDSWPLDQDGIVQVLTSGDYAVLDWDGDYDEESDAIASAQSLRGFHTLAFLIFKDGNARTLSAQ